VVATRNRSRGDESLLLQAPVVDHVDFGALAIQNCGCGSVWGEPNWPGLPAIRLLVVGRVECVDRGHACTRADRRPWSGCLAALLHTPQAGQPPKGGPPRQLSCCTNDTLEAAGRRPRAGEVDSCRGPSVGEVVCSSLHFGLVPLTLVRLPI
jgi:hypothetical protein